MIPTISRSVAMNEWYHAHHIEQPSQKRIKRIVKTVLHNYHQDIIQRISASLSNDSRAAALDTLLVVSDDDTVSAPQAIKTDAGRPSLETVLREFGKLDHISTVSTCQCF